MLSDQLHELANMVAQEGLGDDQRVTVFVHKLADRDRVRRWLLRVEEQRYQDVGDSLRWINAKFAGLDIHLALEPGVLGEPQPAEPPPFDGQRAIAELIAETPEAEAQAGSRVERDSETKGVRREAVA